MRVQVPPLPPNIMLKAIEIAAPICLSYSIVAVNTISMTKQKYLPTFISSSLFMVVNYFLINTSQKPRQRMSSLAIASVESREISSVSG